MSIGKKMAPAAGITEPVRCESETPASDAPIAPTPAPSETTPEETPVSKKKATNQNAPKAPKAPKAEKVTKPRESGNSAIALVVRISKEASEYLKEKAGDRPVTAMLREVLAKGDARLGKLLGLE